MGLADKLFGPKRDDPDVALVTEYFEADRGADWSKKAADRAEAAMDRLPASVVRQLQDEHH